MSLYYILTTLTLLLNHGSQKTSMTLRFTSPGIKSTYCIHRNCHDGGVTIFIQESMEWKHAAENQSNEYTCIIVSVHRAWTLLPSPELPPLHSYLDNFWQPWHNCSATVAIWKDSLTTDKICSSRLHQKAGNNRKHQLGLHGPGRLGHHLHAQNGNLYLQINIILIYQLTVAN